MRETNLCYLFRPGQVLLAMKKRGFGAGKWNGPGGKAQPGESSVGALVREVREEIGVTVQSPEDRGVIEFVYEEKPEWTSRCRIFASSMYDGEPAESDEMRPQWFSIDAVPYDAMWESDRIWFPQFLVGESVRYRVYFDNAARLLRHEPLPL